jgi:mxaA protein
MRCRVISSRPEAWQALHRAFDRTAERSLQPTSLPRLFERAPQYTPLRADIERFYAQSAALFFGDGKPADALPLRSLARRLRDIERRHEA